MLTKIFEKFTKFWKLFDFCKKYAIIFFENDYGKENNTRTFKRIRNL